MGVNWRLGCHGGSDGMRHRLLSQGYAFSLRIRQAFAVLVLCLGAATLVDAAQVTNLNTQTSTATGAGVAGKPSIASFNIPAGKNRAMFVWAAFERDHCSNADAAGGLCVNNNIISTGLGDNWPEPRVGTPPATTTNSQITARVVGPAGTVNKQNALVIGGTPSGDTRFITISTIPNDPDPVTPPNVPPGSAFFSISSFSIVLFENDIDILLGGAASGTVSITFPDVTTPSNAGDDALLMAAIFQNVEQTPTGFVRNATAFAQAAVGVDPAGNYTITVSTYDAGQSSDEADDGNLVLGTNGTSAGFILPAGHITLAAAGLVTGNSGGNYDTPSTAVTINESSLPAGWSLTGATCVNAASATVGSLSGSIYTITSAEIGASVSFVCTFTNSRLPILRLQKALPNGRFVAIDQFALTIAGSGGPAAVTTTGAGNTATGVATISPGAIGAAYTLSETGAASAVLTNYATTYACTNALAGGQAPSGSGVTLNITAVVGDDLTCTLTNVRNNQADLRLTKTNTPGVIGDVDQAADTVVSGASANDSIVVANLGPDAANGSVVVDPAPTNLICSTASCTATGGAACPAPTGAALVAALQGAGASIPTLPLNGAVTITLTCTVG